MDAGEHFSCELSDYCFQVGSLEFQRFNADFANLETCTASDAFKRPFTKLLFFREQLRGEKPKRNWLCYSPSLKT